MKMFKFLKLTIAAMVLIGFASCNDDSDGIDKGIDTNAPAETYLSINLLMPDENSTKRAAGPGTPENSGIEEDGTVEEAEVKSVNLYFFNTNNNNYVTTVSFDNTELNTPDNNFVTSTKKKVALTKNRTYKVFAVVNGVAGITPTTVADFQEIMPTGSFFTSVPSTGLVMSSRTTTGLNESSPYVELEIASSNSENQPAILKFQVERTVAKLTLTGTTSNEHTVKFGSTDIATVKLTDYTVVNSMKTWFMFRHTATAVEVNNIPTPSYKYGDLAPGVAAYVMDPLTHWKNPAAITADPTWPSRYDNYVTTINTASFSNPSFSSSMPNASKIVGYCYENTTERSAQKNGYSTGLIFKAHVTPKDNKVLNDLGTEDIIDPTTVDFYYYDGKFYKDIDALNAVFAPATVDPSLNPADLKKAYGIDLLEKGVCYYKYWIKHYENDNINVMGVMEFGIVRNNLYKMAVTGISSVGPGIITIDPEDDNETSYTYLNMEMSIRPWITRPNDIIL